MILAPLPSAIQATSIIRLLTFSQMQPQPQQPQYTQTWTCVFVRGGGASFSKPYILPVAGHVRCECHHIGIQQKRS